MNHVKEIPKIVKYGKRIPVAINNTIPKKHLTSVCESGILEGKIQDESKTRYRQVRSGTDERQSNTRTKSKQKRKNTDSNSSNVSTTKGYDRLHKEGKGTKDEPASKSRKKKVRSNQTSD